MNLSKKIIAITLMCTSIPLYSNNIAVNAAQNEDVNPSYDTVNKVKTLQRGFKINYVGKTREVNGIELQKVGQ